MVLLRMRKKTWWRFLWLEMMRRQEKGRLLTSCLGELRRISDAVSFFSFRPSRWDQVLVD
jgi:hypothetical protein